MDAIDVYLSLRQGDPFILRGRRLAYRVGGGNGCFSYYSAVSEGGERAVCPVWNEQGKPTTVTIRPDSKIEVPGDPQ